MGPVPMSVGGKDIFTLRGGEEKRGGINCSKK